MSVNNLPPSAAEALRVATLEFAKLDSDDVCRRTGATFDKANNKYLLPCLGGTAKIDAVDCSLEWESTAQAKFHLVLLHYLIYADGSIPKGERISLHQVAPAGSAWAERMIKSATPPLANVFGEDIPCLYASAEKLGGQKLSEGTVEIPVLPHLPVYLTVWEKDDEFPADARILLDATLPRQLPGEDRLVVAEFTVLALLEASGKPFSMPGMGERKAELAGL